MVKGNQSELELQKILWEKGYATVRVAGSGTSRFPAPDLLANNGQLPLVIECKSTSKEKVYVRKKELLQLHHFTKVFGGLALLAIRFNREPWYLLQPVYGDEKDKSICYSKPTVIEKGDKVSKL